MPEVPYIIVDNVLSDATTVTASLAAVTGFEATKLYDNLHHTSYKTTSATSPAAFTITPSAHAKINCVVVDCKFADPGGYYLITVNGSTVLTTITTQDIVEGPILLTFTEAVAISATTSIVVNLYSTLTTKEVRHLWVGYYRAIKNPLIPHDPIQDTQVFRTQENQDGNIINNAPIYTQRVLDASWEMISPTDYANFDYLRTNSFYPSTPFWYFLHPASEPKVGHLYFWDQDSYFRPFALAGFRNLAIKAKANVSPDRTPDRYPFAFSKAMTFNGTDDKGTCTQFSCGTTHTVEFWMDQATPGALEYISAGTTGGASNIAIDATKIYYTATTDQVFVLHGGFGAGSKWHIIITRTGDKVNFYKNNVQIGTEQTLASSAVQFYIVTVGNSSTTWLSGKLAHLRIYNWVINSTQRALQYNSGLGADRLPGTLYAAWEFDSTGGTGGAGSAEDNQEGTASKDLTLAGSGLTRAAW